MASRFINFGQTPIGEGVQELPIDILAGKAQDLQKQNDLALQGYLKTFSPVKAAPGSMLNAEAANKLIDEESKRLTEELLAPGANVDMVLPKLMKANKLIQENPDYKTAVAFDKYRDEFAKLHKDVIDKGHIANYLDARGNVINNPAGNLANPETFFGYTPYVDVNKVFNEGLSKITPLLSEWAGEDISGVTQNDQGDYFAVAKSGKTKKLDESVAHVKAALDALPYEAFNNPQTRSYFQEATNRGLIPDYAPEGDLYAKGRGYLQTLFPKYRQYESTGKTNYTKLGNVVDNASKIKETQPGSVLPLSNSFENTPYTLEDFKTSAKASAATRNDSWNSTKNSVIQMSPQLRAAAGITGVLTGKSGYQTVGLTEGDLNKIVKYASSVNPNTLSPTDRAALDAAKNNAISYLAANRTLDFYKNQARTVVDKVYKEKGITPKKNDPILKSIEDGNFDFKYGHEIIGYQGPTAKPIYGDTDSAFIDDIKKGIEKAGSLNLDNAYISLDNTSKGYSKTSYDLAHNVWNDASQKGLLFEGMDAKADPSEAKAGLFEKLTGSAPEGKLEPVGAAIDKNGRIGIIVKDEKTGNTATFIKPTTLAYTPYIKKYYKEIAGSDDYIAKPVAYSGYLDTYLTEQGAKSTFDNFLNSNHDVNFNIGGLDIKKTGNNFTYQDATGTHQFTSPDALKADIGELIIKAGK